MFRRALTATIGGLAVTLSLLVAPTPIAYASAPIAAREMSERQLVLPAVMTLASPASTPLSFSDVSSAHQFHREISWLADEGVSRGWKVGTRHEFRPSQAVTRDAMAAFLYRLAGQPAYSAPPASPFRDVPTSHQFYKEISWLADSGISTGWSVASGKEFRPSNRITRDAMAAFLYRFDGSPSFSPTGASPFRDVNAQSAFSKEVRWLAAAGISTGTNIEHGCREFRPSHDVSRDAMAAFMYRLVNGGTAPVTENTCNPPPAPPGKMVGKIVSSGAFCANAERGWYGHTSNGTLMQCKTTAADSRLRWRAA